MLSGSADLRFLAVTVPEDAVAHFVRLGLTPAKGLFRRHPRRPNNVRGRR